MDEKMNLHALPPIDDYDPRWVAFNLANPGLFRSVGAAATNDDAAGESADDDAGDGAADKGGDKKPIDPQVAKLLKDMMRHKDRAKEAATRADTAEKERTALLASLQEAFGLEKPEEITGMLTKLKADEEGRLKAAGEFDKLKSRLVSEHEKERKKLEDTLKAEVTTLKSQLDAASSEVRRLLVSNSFGSSPFVTDEMTLTPAQAERLFGANFKVEAAADGRMTVKAYLDDKPLVNKSGETLSFDEALREIVNADPGKDRLIRTKAKPGAGSGTLGRTGVPGGTTEIRGAQRIAAALEVANK